MSQKEQSFIESENLKNLSKEELIENIYRSKLETIKYANSFLEVEEKWSFVNILLKKLNAIRQKQELCKTICDGFLKLTNSKISVCCLFNQDNCRIEYKRIAHNKNEKDITKTIKFIEKVNETCCSFLEKSYTTEKFISYFKSISRGNLIAVPITYNKIFLGYLMLVKDDEDFYKENIHFVQIFPEHIALILENISLYIESEKRNKQKIEFLAGISHEFKTPLNSIIGFSEILKSKLEELDNVKYIENISQSSKHLLSLIEDVLDVSKSQYNSLELNYTIFNTKDVILKIIMTFEEMIAEKQIDINFTLCEIKISADIKRFRQLIYNLLSNAIKFNKQGGKIDIFTYTKNNIFIFEITDTGDGISKRNKDKIFDFFSQVNRSQLKRQLGSGVGLALCKIITDAHQGEINFKSQIKKGSCFWFNLPNSKP